jgi:hypothetical protein
MLLDHFPPKTSEFRSGISQPRLIYQTTGVPQRCTSKRADGGRAPLPDLGSAGFWGVKFLGVLGVKMTHEIIYITIFTSFRNSQNFTRRAPLATSELLLRRGLPAGEHLTVGASASHVKDITILGLQTW